CPVDISPTDILAQRQDFWVARPTLEPFDQAQSFVAIHHCTFPGGSNSPPNGGFRSSRLSPTGPSAGLLCLREMVMAPVELWIAAGVSVSATPGRPCTSQI